ncbi:hypothetical protein TraAM80_04946 [Trypanosoma rangeli]|uniref:Enriched in surface-labeled proteome protein 11 n=1 Tax=Trypanosoma rangeli TaxID=5698 RepID=A0A422NGS8_TRYRA|nr:uncharacterized protein TraAM80_04946 [Trypanosoma rangeli]RNF04651.1 hypothetical protein TraAM80_04946 [Trypanosoma rangeli]|eukprot:RNF04651.1 hypothetical protein TraAM80_04946 [Trypanosoma rangeli]
MIMYYLPGALAVLFFSNAVMAIERCRPIANLRGINPRILTMPTATFYLDNEYFCADKAPLQFYCQCGVVSICTKHEDPWGRDIGVCGCCPWWIIVLFILFGIVVVASVSTVLYVWFCRGKWWWDGYPPPIRFVMCRRGPSTVVPATGPLPPNLFRGYRISDFVSGSADPQLTHATAAACNSTESRRLTDEGQQLSHQQQQQQQQREQQLRLCQRTTLHSL